MTDEQTDSKDTAGQIASCGQCLPDEWDEAVETMEAIILGDIDTDDVLCDTHDLEFQKESAEYVVGTRDLDEADRRLAILDEWHRTTPATPDWRANHDE